MLLFISKLSKMTFKQGMPEIFLTYIEEHLEAYPGQGLCSAKTPLDKYIVDEYVLAEKADTSLMVAKLLAMEKRVEAAESRVNTKLQGSADHTNTTKQRLDNLEERMKKMGEKKNGPPGPDNPCTYCKGTDHFIGTCPKRLEDEEKKKAAKAAASSSG